MPRKLGCLAVLVVCLVALAPAGASASTVANTNDSGPGSLREAVEDAVPGETIVLPAGDYKLTSGEIVIEKSLTIAGAGSGSTTIEGGNFRTFDVEGEGNSVTISGVALRGNSPSEDIIQGGVVYVLGASLTLSGVTVGDVTATAESTGIVEGGVVFAGGEGTLAIRDSTISRIAASVAGASGHGGGVIEGGAIFVGGMKLTVEGTSITDVSTNARGGQGPSSSSQNGGVIEGGAIFASAIAAEGTIRSSTIGRASADARPGPGANGGVVLGGGLFVSGSNGELTLDRNTIADNSAQVGSGVAKGGGAFLVPAAEPATIRVLASTIASNGGGEGGGVFGVDAVRFADTIVAGNSGAPGKQECDLEEPAEPVSEGHNLDSTDQCGFHGEGDIVNADPQLGPLQNNGGPVETMLPAGTSPVVDKGASLGLSADARGLTRPVDFPSIANAPGGDGSDIGAVEVQASNSFSFGKLTRNKKKGTATLVVNLPAPPNAGTLALSGAGLKPQGAALTGTATSIALPVIATGKVIKALRKKGKRAIGITVTLQPPGGAAASQTLKTKLFKKLKRRHHRHHHKRRHGKHRKKKG